LKLIGWEIMKMEKNVIEGWCFDTTCCLVTCTSSMCTRLIQKLLSSAFDSVCDLRLSEMCVQMARKEKEKHVLGDSNVCVCQVNQSARILCRLNAIHSPTVFVTSICDNI
jgi:hypothetical protein